MVSKIWLKYSIAGTYADDTQTSVSNSEVTIEIKIGKEFIERSNCAKLLGITFESSQK